VSRHARLMPVAALCAMVSVILGGCAGKAPAPPDAPLITADIPAPVSARRVAADLAVPPGAGVRPTPILVDPVDRAIDQLRLPQALRFAARYPDRRITADGIRLTDGEAMQLRANVGYVGDGRGVEGSLAVIFPF